LRAAFRPLLRILPLLGIVTAVLFIAFLRPEAEYLVAELTRHHAALSAFVAAHFPTAILAFAAVYFLTKALFLPAGPFLTATGGLLLGTAATTIAGSIAGAFAAALLYFVADRGIGRGLRARAIPFVDRIATGFRRYGFSYLVAFRLVPIVPFWAGCFVPALLGVRFSTYLLATLVGSFPSIFLYASLGQGLGAVLDEGDASWESLSRPAILAPLFGLAVLALIPVLWSKLRLFSSPPRKSV
jgi:uncharacterized membrane protein YdjX (TVP38/TMEM64 family)